MNNAAQDIDTDRFPCTAQVLAELETTEPSDYAPTAPPPAPPPAASTSVPPMSLANELAMALARGIFGR